MRGTILAMSEFAEAAGLPPLVWLNGAFGAGKTSVARELASRWPEARLFDPEEIGFLLRRVVPTEPSGDFQDLPLWRRLTVATALGLLHDYRRPLIVPMTLVDPRYFSEIIGGLRSSGVEVHHFALLASAATLRRRLRWRWSRPSSRRWALAQIDRCSAALSAPELGQHIPTDGRTIGDIADEILQRLGPPLPQLATGTKSFRPGDHSP